MAIYCTTLRLARLLINLLCNTVVPMVESIATKFRIGGCYCPGTPFSPEIEYRGRGKRRKHKNGDVSSNHTEQHNGKDVKRLKLLLDITVRENGGKEPEVEVRESARFVEDMSEPSIFVRLFNLPSSIVLFFTSKLRKWAHDLDDLENESCGTCVSNRIKKSPKRRITRSNYRRIIPFFPFNLLGFSNYSAFQMPSLTHCKVGAEEMNHLNVSTVSGRCKRRRSSSVYSSDSELDICNDQDRENTAREKPEDTIFNGHDEVDSDESADTTKQVSSSSNEEQESRQEQKLNGNAFKETIAELDEANENYDSADDPDYSPNEFGNSTNESSYNTDSISDESFLSSSKLEDSSATSHASITSAVEATVENSNRKSVSSLPIDEPSQNGHNNHQQNGHHPDAEDAYKTPEEEEHENLLF